MRTPTETLRHARRRLDEERLVRSVSPLARTVKNERLTYLSWTKLRNLERCLSTVRRQGTPGDFLEAGVALGGSAIVLASRLDEGRAFHGYDVFGQIPPPSDRDDPKALERYRVIAQGESSGIAGDEYYGYMPDLYHRVVENFRRFDVAVDDSRVVLHPGLFEQTLWPSTPVALAHIDSDWYEPVKLGLERLHPWLSPGGFIVLDDYYDYGGCAEATREFLAGADHGLQVVEDEGNLVLRRQS